MTLDKLNKLNSAQAKHFFMQCCTSSKWVERMVKALPYSDELALKEAANKAWQDLDKRDYETYCTLYESMIQYLSAPNLIIFLKRPTATMLYLLFGIIISANSLVGSINC